jgi:hypothetical protein
VKAGEGRERPSPAADCSTGGAGSPAGASSCSSCGGTPAKAGFVSVGFAGTCFGFHGADATGRGGQEPDADAFARHVEADQQIEIARVQQLLAERG